MSSDLIPEKLAAQVAAQVAATRHAERVTTALAGEQSAIVLVRDLDQDLPDVWGRPVHSVFFGGGTPSLFPPEAIADILDACSAWAASTTAPRPKRR